MDECLKRNGSDFTVYEGISTNAQGREEFMAQWKLCPHGDGEGPLDLALKRAKASPHAFETECAFGFYVQFLNLCDQLQGINRADPIALPVHEVGRRLGVTGATVSEYIKQALEERYLVQVGNHCFNRNGAGKARTFHFCANRNPIATELMRDFPKRPRGMPAWAMDDD